MIGTSLTIDADAPQRGDDDVDYQTDKRNPHVHDEEDGFDEEDEHRQHGDDDIEIGYAVFCQ